MATESKPIDNLAALREQNVERKQYNPTLSLPSAVSQVRDMQGQPPAPDMTIATVGNATPIQPFMPDESGTKPSPPGPGTPVTPGTPGTTGPSVGGTPGGVVTAPGAPGGTQPFMPGPAPGSGVPTWGTSTGNPNNASPPAAPSTVNVGGGTSTPGADWAMPDNIRPTGDRPEFLGETPADMPTATQWDVTAEQTVAGQFASIMDSSNPAFQVIQEQVRRAQAASGRQNSLMADRSVVMALAEVGFRMASQDAATYARSAEFNAAMRNQFGLAEQAFMYNAMLSDQNFRQGVMMLREQHAATIDQINADLRSRLAQIGATATAEIQIANNAQANNLALMDRAHGQALEQAEVNFQYGWTLNEQGQNFALEQTAANANAQSFLGAQQFNYQMQLNYLSEMGANGRQLLATIEGIGGNPNITAAQASAAIADAIRNYNAVNQQLSSAYALPLPGTASPSPGQAPVAPGPGTKSAGAAPGLPAPGTYNTPAYNYMLFTPRTPTPPPVIPFYGGGATGPSPSPGYPGAPPAPGGTGNKPVPPTRPGFPSPGPVNPLPVPGTPPSPGGAPIGRGRPYYPIGAVPGVPGSGVMQPGISAENWDEQMRQRRGFLEK